MTTSRFAHGVTSPIAVSWLYRSCLLFLCALAMSCTKPTESLPVPLLPPTINDSTDITDENVLRAVYSEYKYPAGFYQEDLKGGSLYHENTVSILPLRQRQPHWFELSTNDHDQAFAWSEASSIHSSYYRTLESERETERFFEFRRVWLAQPTDILLSRVYKSSYVDRSMYDRLDPGDTLAILRATPIDTATARELVEYLWYYDHYNMGGSKVLCSYVEDLQESVRYVLFFTSVAYGDWGVCDRIYVYRLIYAVSRLDGVLTCSSELIRTLTGRCH